MRVLEFWYHWKYLRHVYSTRSIVWDNQTQSCILEIVASCLFRSSFSLSLSLFLRLPKHPLIPVETIYPSKCLAFFLRLKGHLRFTDHYNVMGNNKAPWSFRFSSLKLLSVFWDSVHIWRTSISRHSLHDMYRYMLQWINMIFSFSLFLWLNHTRWQHTLF